MAWKRHKRLEYDPVAKRMQWVWYNHEEQQFGIETDRFASSSGNLNNILS